MMKKIICILLILTCVFAVASCKKDPAPTPTPQPAPQPEVINDIIAKSAPTKIVSIVEYVTATDTLKSVYTTEIDRVNNKARLIYDINELGNIAAGDPERIMHYAGEIYYADGAVKHYTDSSWSTAVGLAPDFKLDMSRALFAEYVVSEDGTTVTGKVTGENVAKVLGIEGLGATEMTVKVMTNGTYIYSLDITYTTSTGATVVVNTSYTYNTITLDF